MINVTRELNITADEFFGFLEESIRYDVETHQNKKIKNEIKSGFEYKKKLSNKLGQKGDVIVTIEKFEPPNVYKSKIYSNQGFNYIYYEVSKIDDNNISVKYEEDYTSSSKFNNLNYTLMSKFYKKRSLRRMNAILTNIERYILNQKKENEQCQD